MSHINKSKFFLLFFVCLSLAWAIADEPKFKPSHLKHWAYKPYVKPAIPTVTQRAWVKNPVDAFILRDLEKNQISPSKPADKITLLRRASFDLTGLPPTPEEVKAFVADRSPKAYEKVIDRLLASPAYGEKWARHWLDLARYAESDGFKADDTRPNIWRYRDYVIKSFNEDKPYNLFIKEQIAGDELYPEKPDALVATGFNRHYPDEYNARNLMQRRQEILNDVTDTVGAVFMGTTYGCARCHDHKYDPVLQKDYYKLQAFFAASRAKDDYILASAAEQKEYKFKQANWEEKTKDIRAEIAKLETPHVKALYDEHFEKFPAEIQTAINTPAEKRDTMQWLMYHKSQWQLNYGVDEDGNGVKNKLKGEQKKQWENLRAQLATFDSSKPKPLPIGSGITDVGAEAPKHFLLNGGGYDNYGDEVQPGFLTIIDKNSATVSKPTNCESTGRRTALANWLTDPKNPLVSRVMVNRLWSYHFGRGIVGSPSDFGMMREPETNLDLLNFLSATLVEKGWSIKAMHKIMMLSNTYQQASDHREDAAAKDPDNLQLWKFHRQRLSGEEIRDAILSVSGKLNRTMGGPSVFPDIPKEMEVRGGWNRKENEDAKNRRSVYVFVRRNSRYPMFHAFDMPDTHESCSRRINTTTAPQALSLLNDKAVLDSAKALAARAMKSSSNSEDWIKQAYLLAFTRVPNAQELETASKFLRTQAAVIMAQNAEASFVDFCHVLLNSNEFVYVN